MKDWTKKAPLAVTVCGKDWEIKEINEKAAAVFAKYGGAELKGRNLLNCHNENSIKKLMEMSARKASNIYTIEKSGVKKLIYQFPWEDEAGFAGYVELSLELPEKIPHFIRKQEAG